MPNPYNTADGTITGNGAIATVTIGFQPALVIVTNETTGIIWHVNSGNSATITTKYNTTGPVISIDNTSAIVITTTGFTISAAANVNAATITWVAFRRES